MINDFDFAAKEYDRLFTNSQIGRAQRNRVYNCLDSILKTNKTLNILELNCGTGEDAIKIASVGHNVIATDISQAMISVCKSKNTHSNIKFKALDINTLTCTSFDKTFDILFSNFGGLNCLSPLKMKQFLETSAKLLTSNGKLVLVIMPKYCLWERLYFSFKADFKKAKRRQTDTAVLANVEGKLVKTWYYNPEDIIALTSENYTIKQVQPIGLTIPPSYLEPSLLSKPLSMRIFKWIDNLFTHKKMAKYADHYLIELQLI